MDLMTRNLSSILPVIRAWPGLRRTKRNFSALTVKSKCPGTFSPMKLIISPSSSLNVILTSDRAANQKKKYKIGSEENSLSSSATNNDSTSYSSTKIKLLKNQFSPGSQSNQPTGRRLSTRSIWSHSHCRIDHFSSVT